MYCKKAFASTAFFDPSTGQPTMPRTQPPSGGKTNSAGKPVSAKALTRPEPQTPSTAWPLWNNSTIFADEDSYTSTLGLVCSLIILKPGSTFASLPPPSCAIATSVCTPYELLIGGITSFLRNLRSFRSAQEVGAGHRFSAKTFLL